ncbi:CPBP family intramembrane glutamic endopeptidase [Halosegnis marinus]|uniref:CPBP family intramembrane glutamic endopeptidase n=1 Tax=Halosegnis marinus TaxID=3034023 RepID=A0ABD5ZLU9_9EURY|nr:CPBP family intramembrane glutamic endopeptidase [Halosegnis sp. DT85]
MSRRARLRARLAGRGGPLSRLSWVQRALLVGLALAAVWSWWYPAGLNERVFKDLTLYLTIPAALAVVHGRHLGWRVDRRALRNTLLLAAFVTPFYLVGSSLPSVRAYYPMWGGTLDNFWVHSVKQFAVVLAAETYYRGLLCVGVREVGRKAAFISPVIYAFHHLGKPPIELLLSGPTDVLFGLVDYESDSILPSVVAHGFGLLLLDWLVLHDPLIPTETVVRALSWLPLPL